MRNINGASLCDKCDGHITYVCADYERCENGHTTEPTKGPLDGLNICFSGVFETMTRAEAKQAAEFLGAKVTGSVHSKSDLLVAGPGAGSKLAMAENLGVRVIHEAKFSKLLTAGPDAIKEFRAGLDVSVCKCVTPLPYNQWARMNDGGFLDIDVQVPPPLAGERMVKGALDINVQAPPPLHSLGPLTKAQEAQIEDMMKTIKGKELELEPYVGLTNMGGDYCGHGLAADYPEGHEDDATEARYGPDGEWYRKADVDVALKERIVAAAILVDGVTISLPQPARHGQVLWAASGMGLSDHMVQSACQGFLTSSGRFVNRVQAKQIAHIAQQPQLRPEKERQATELFSEDLW